jgi:pentatricopeptide repeat protein
MNARYPDFKHKKKTEDALWLGDRRNPPWVAAEVAAMPPGTVQMGSFSWNRRLAKFVKTGEYEKTMELFKQMQKEGMRPDRFTFVPVLNACAGLRALEEGRRAHELIMQTGCEADVFVGSSLVDMYAKCGHMEDALRVFNKMPSRDVVTWSALILGHVKYGQGQKALELFRQMQQEGVEPNPVTFIGVLNACASLIALEEGRCVHEQMIRCGCELDAFVGSSLVDMYTKCGSMEDAWRVFNKMPSRDAVTWTAMILGHVNCGQGQKALDLFQKMQQEGVHPDAVTFVGVLNACASIMALEEGRRAHELIIQSGYESDAFVGSSLIDMYAKCGSMEEASRVFNKLPSRAVVCWTAMIFGHVKCGEGHKALELFQKMQQEGVHPDAVTFVGVLNACASIMALEEGRRAHEQIIRSRCESDFFVRNSLVDMYAKCGSMEDACRVFNTMPSHDVVSWNALLGGFAMHGQHKEALVHFERMCEEGVHPDDITFVCLLSACSHGGFMDEGLRFYALMTTV